MVNNQRSNYVRNKLQKLVSYGLSQKTVAEGSKTSKSSLNKFLKGDVAYGDMVLDRLEKTIDEIIENIYSLKKG